MDDTEHTAERACACREPRVRVRLRNDPSLEGASRLQNAAKCSACGGGILPSQLAAVGSCRHRWSYSGYRSRRNLRSCGVCGLKWTKPREGPERSAVYARRARRGLADRATGRSAACSLYLPLNEAYSEDSSYSWTRLRRLPAHFLSGEAAAAVAQAHFARSPHPEEAWVRARARAIALAVRDDGLPLDLTAFLRAVTQNTEEWRAWRKLFLSASDFASAAHLNEYSEPGALWACKLGKITESFTEDKLAIFARGHELEAVSREHYALATAFEPRATGIWVVPGTSWLSASPDWLTSGNVIGENKAPLRRVHDLVPRRYMPQIQGQLEATGREFCDFVSFYQPSGGASPPIVRVYRASRSRAYWRALLEKLVAMLSCLDTDTRPLDRDFPRFPAMPQCTVVEVTNAYDRGLAGRPLPV